MNEATPFRKPKSVIRAAEGPTGLSLLQECCAAVGFEEAGGVAGKAFGLFPIEEPVRRNLPLTRERCPMDAHDPGRSCSFSLVDGD